MKVPATSPESLPKRARSKAMSQPRTISISQSQERFAPGDVVELMGLVKIMHPSGRPWDDNHINGRRGIIKCFVAEYWASAFYMVELPGDGRSRQLNAKNLRSVASIATSPKTPERFAPGDVVELMGRVKIMHPSGRSWDDSHLNCCRGIIKCFVDEYWAGAFYMVKLPGDGRSRQRNAKNVRRIASTATSIQCPS